MKHLSKINLGMVLFMFFFHIGRTRSGPREDKNMSSFVECGAVEKWLESSYEAEGPYYMITLAMFLASPLRWNKIRAAFVRRLLVMAHARHVCPSAPSGSPLKLPDTTVKDYTVYKSALTYFGLIDGIYSQFFRVSLHFDYIVQVLPNQDGQAGVSGALSTVITQSLTLT